VSFLFFSETGMAGKNILLEWQLPWRCVRMQKGGFFRMENKEGWTEVLVTYDALEAEMVKDVLESGGIEVVLRSSKVSPYPVNIGKMGEITVLVRDADREEALEVISGRSDEGPGASHQG
jgi:hypothetical protein